MIDVLMIFFVVGMISGSSLVGIAWLLWWETERQSYVCPCMESDDR